MKKKIILALFISCSLMLQSSLLAQENSNAKVLFGNENPIDLKDVGFFIAPAYSFTSMDGSAASLFNLRGGLIMKDKFSIGAFFNTSLNEIRPESETVQEVYMDYWTVGGFAEYTLFTNKIAHLTLPLYIGYGEVQMDNREGEASLGEANFFKIEPSALLEINLHKNVRFNIGAGYRFIGDMNYRNFDQSDLSGLTGTIGLKFGIFK